jgi:hypothetical protein
LRPPEECLFLPQRQKFMKREMTNVREKWNVVSNTDLKS